VQPLEAARALALTLARDVRELTSQRFAMGSGLAGVVLVGVAIVGVAAVAHADDELEPPTDFALDFTPGTLARLGSEPDAADATGDAQPATAPAKPEPPTAEPDAPPETKPETATDDPDAAPARPQPPTPQPARPQRPRPEQPPSADPSRGGGRLPGPPSDDDGGNPWGDPNGWDDLTRDGDAWATGVVAALRGLEVGWYAGDPAPGEFRFEISVCKDGTITAVKKAGGTMSADGQSRVRLALEQLKLKPIPKRLADHMPAKCARIDHVFVWSSDAVK
jgi:hypothetical protein